MKRMDVTEIKKSLNGDGKLASIVYELTKPGMVVGIEGFAGSVVVYLNGGQRIIANAHPWDRSIIINMDAGEELRDYMERNHPGLLARLDAGVDMDAIGRSVHPCYAPQKSY